MSREQKSQERRYLRMIALLVAITALLCALLLLGMILWETHLSSL